MQEIRTMENAAVTSSKGARSEKRLSGRRATGIVRTSSEWNWLRWSWCDVKDVIRCEAPEHPSREALATRRRKGHKQQTITSHPIPSHHQSSKTFSHTHPTLTWSDNARRKIPRHISPNPTYIQDTTNEDIVTVCQNLLVLHVSSQERATLPSQYRSLVGDTACDLRRISWISSAPQNICKLQLGNCSSPSINLLEVFHPSFGSEDLNWEASHPSPPST